MYSQAALPYLIALIILPHVVSASAITAAPIPLARRQGGVGSPECEGFYSVESSCSAATTNFLSLEFDQQASCLCYSGSAYEPSIYDSYISTCLAFLATASPAYYSSIGGSDVPTAPCVELAAASGTGASTAVMTGAAASSLVDPNAVACTSWNAIQESCSQATPSFSAMDFSQEASCLCYTDSTYAPSIYDGYWGSCLAYYQTAAPSFYTTNLDGDAVDRTPCASAGNVRASPTITSTPSAANTSPSSVAASTTASPLQTSTTEQSSSATTTAASSTTGSSKNGAVTLKDFHASIAALVVLAAVIFAL